MNTLQNLLHEGLIGTRQVSNACFIRIRDANLLTSSTDFNPNSEQLQAFVDAFRNPSQTREKGLYYDGKAYECLRADKNSIYARLGESGIIIVKTNTMLVVGIYITGMFPSVCIEACESLAEYFKEKGK